MKNYKISKRAVRKGLALVCVGTIFTGVIALSVSGKLPSDGRDDYDKIQVEVSNRKALVISEVFSHYHTFESIKSELQKKGFPMSDEEIQKRLDEYNECFSNDYEKEVIKVYSLN